MERDDLQHKRDRRLFKNNMARVAITEQLMRDQRRKLGLPENPKPLKIQKPKAFLGKLTEI